MARILLQGGRVVTDQGAELSDVLLENGVITAIGSSIKTESDHTIDCSGKYLLPGLIDCHVHFREPGLTHKATMLTEAQAAQAGGVMTVCEMPNTIPPAVTIQALQQKVDIASQLPASDPSLQHFDIRFFFGVTERQHLDQLQILWTDPAHAALRSRCAGVKLYLDHSTGDQKVDGGLLPEIFSICSKLNIPVVAHCEDAEMNRAAQIAVGRWQMAEKKIASSWQQAANSGQKTEHHPSPRGGGEGGGGVDLHSLMRPAESEAASIKFALGLARQFKTRFHIAHLSTAAGLEHVRQAKKDLPHVTCEVAPHHLFFTVDDYSALGTLVKMNPPLRTLNDRDALWAGIIDGTVDCIATDHAPHTLAEKQNPEPLQAPSGVPGVELTASLLITALLGQWPNPLSLRPTQLPILSCDEAYATLYRLCFSRPNQIFSLQKSSLTVGQAVSIVIFDPAASKIIHATDLHSLCGWTPYEGWNVCGQIITAV